MLRYFRALMLAGMSALAASALSDPVTLRFVVWDGNEAAKALRAELQNFEAAHPNIRVKFEMVNRNYQEKLLAQVAAKVAPDVAMMDPGNFQRYARRGAILPLNRFFNETPGFNINDYYKNLVDAHALDGQLYVLPRDIAPIAVIYYNKKLFREAGIPYPDGKWTYDFDVRPELKERDFLWVIQQLTKTDGSGRPSRWGFAPGWKEIFRDMVALQMGARVLDDYKSPHRIQYDDPRQIRATEFAVDLALNKRWIPSDVEISNVLQSNSRQMFTQQKVAMYLSGIWEVPELRKELQPGKAGYFDWDIALAPVYVKGEMSFPTGGSGYSILSQTKHPHEAWQLVQWMAGKPGMLAMAKAGIAQPGIRSLALAEPWIPGPNTAADQQVPHNRIITDIAAQHVVFSPSSIYWNEVNGIATVQHGLVWTGERQAKDVFGAGNELGNARLARLVAEESLPRYNWSVGAVVGAVLFLGLLGWIYLPERQVRRSRRQRKENRTAYLFILPWIIGVVVFTAGPMVLSLLMSFSDWDIIQPARWRGLGNYQEAATTDPSFWKSLSVTVTYTVFAVPLGIAASLALAMLLNTKVRGMPLWRTCYYLPSIASVVAASQIWKKVFQVEGGLLNSLIFGTDGHGNFLGLASLLAPIAKTNGLVNWLGQEQTALSSLILMSIWGAGGGMVILLAGLQGVPTYLYEAATLDGASPWRRFRTVTVPMISPTLFFTLITGFIGSFQVFASALLMTDGGPNMATNFYMLHLYKQAFFSLRMGYASALAWVLFFVILMFTIIQLKASKWVYYEGAK